MKDEFIILIAPRAFDTEDALKTIRTADGLRTWERCPEEGQEAFKARVAESATGGHCPVVWLDETDLEL
ncbi:hypothetical protein [Methylocella silvestris]|uniref:Uncharacterized protein n=1 Tax=Methylocella silvestris TaxID=199596 RepID=A0A2J7TG01_METSI|nr:hypothetical protein [Methylocella silvestris]PNG25705.1 hypothetical protein CR492_12370 [Methylocella silvestris]